MAWGEKPPKDRPYAALFCLGVTTVEIHAAARGFLQSTVQIDQASLHRQRDCLGAIGSAELTHNRADMEFRRTLADYQLRGDLVVGLALCQQLQYLYLALCKLFYWG